LLHAKVAIAGVATVVVAMVDSVVSAETVVRVRRETDHQVETVAPVRLGIGHSVHKGIAPHVRRVSVVRVRKETDHKVRVVSVRLVSHVHRVNAPRVRRVSVHLVHRVSDLHEPNRLLQLSRPRRRHLSHQLKPLRRLPHRQHQTLVRLRAIRASRGDAKPCYWHRHVQSTADNIAVA
jgi:hypothetical protein